jgi:cyclophilin family peptidyl-prolyl cis-trans isomerase
MRFRPNWFRSTGKPRRSNHRLQLTQLEAREVPTVTIADIPDQSLFTDRPLFLPVTVTNTPAGPVTVTVQSGNDKLQAEVVTGGRSLVLNVSGKDAQGQDFTGTLTIRLFENVAPLATGNIISLVQSGFYNNKVFHRIIDAFMIQGGSPNGDGIGGSNLPDVIDEFNRDYTFASSGLLAMANAGDDNNNSQFFITDIDQSIANRPNHLNFDHTIVGLLTDGFDTYQKIITTPVNGSTPLNAVTIKSASIITDTENAVIKLTPLAGFTGTANITVTANDGVGAPASDTAILTGVTATTPQGTPLNDNPFLGPITNPTTSVGTPVAVNLTSTDLQNDPVTYQLTASGANASQVTINLNAATGAATITPVSGFVGAVDLIAKVSDANGRLDTQKFTMTVTAGSSQSTTTVTLSKATIVVGAPVTITATIGNVTSPKGTVEFFQDGTLIGKANVYDGHAAITYTPSAAGTDAITAKFTSTNAAISGSTSSAVNLAVTAGTAPRKLFSPTGAGVGSKSFVSAEDSQGAVLLNTPVFGGNFTGGVRIAVADVTGDGQEDIVAAAGFGGSAIIQVVDGGSGKIVFTRMMFEDTFRGGLTVAAADLQGKGYAQVVVGAGRTGGPRVTVWDVKTNAQAYNYFAYDSTLRGGVSIDAADIRGNGFAIILTGTGEGGGPIVGFFDGFKAGTGTANQIPAKFGQMVFGNPANRAGIVVGEAAVEADLTRKVLVAPFGTNVNLGTPLDPFDPVQGVFVGP